METPVIRNRSHLITFYAQIHRNSDTEMNLRGIIVCKTEVFST